MDEPLHKPIAGGENSVWTAVVVADQCLLPFGIWKCYFCFEM